MKKIFALLITTIICFNAVGTVCADSDLDKAVSQTAEYVKSAVLAPTVGSIGGEWAVMGLKRSGCDIEEGYFEKYYQNLISILSEKGGKLSERKYTEYSRAVIALTAIGKDPKDVSGYDVLSPLYDFDKTVWQGVNGAVFALLALDSGNYDVSGNLKEQYIDEILKYQMSDGGFAFDIDSQSDVDMTAMALQALSKYQAQENVKKSTEKALEFLSVNQLPDGGFASGNSETAESVSQVVIALCELSVPITDSKFVKNGKTTVDNLLSFMCKNGGFLHKLSDSTPNQMSTEQALCALSALKRKENGKSSLYDMTDNKADVGVCALFGLNAAREIYGVYKNEK